MATIALYANKINQMPGLIKDVKNSVVNYKSELSSLKTKVLNINRSVCNLDDVVSSIQSSSQTQEKKITTLETFSNKSEEFISEAVRIDGEAATVINERKDDFYEQYDYLKPECEKSGWEKFCDTCQSVVDWCRDNWQAIGKILIAVVIVVALGIATALTGGILGVILAGAFWGALAGGLIGGIMGGVMSVMNGGSFLDGFADGALSGVISGAITGAACAGLGALGAAVGKSIQCISTLGKAITVTSKVSAVLSLGMDAFDLLALGISFFDPTNPLVTFNQQLHSSALYNGFQIFVNALAVFTAGAASTMKCFVAGTLILTAAGFVAIENIKVGDKVISTNPDTLEVAEKTVLETYIRETRELLHLTINGELIKTTFEHPFYVNDVGFVEAGKLEVGDKLLDTRGNILVVEAKELEVTDEAVKVYNFKVDEFHTYHVGDNEVLVHNANYNTGIDIEVSKADLDEYRQSLGVSETHTVAVGKTDVPGLEGQNFSGASPKVRQEAGLPSLDEIAPNREIKAPTNVPLNRNHAEEGLMHEFVEAVKDAGLNPSEVKGTLNIIQSNPRGVCPTCLQGLSDPSIKPGIFRQFSEKFPNLEIRVITNGAEGVKPFGRQMFSLLNGKYI